MVNDINNIKNLEEITMTYNDALRDSTRESIIDDSEIEEILEYIRRQIKNPFSVDVNYFKPLKRKITNKATLISTSLSILSVIDEEYPSISIELTEENDDVVKYAYNIYKFFIKNINSMVYIFLKEYISNNKNRKNLVAPYLDVKVDSYPKEQYGKKENYILLAKIDSIMKDIKNLDTSLVDFINYVNRANDSAAYIDLVAELVDHNIIIDKGIVKDIMKKFIKSDEYNQIINKLSIWINKHIIAPCLKDLGYDGIQYVIFEEEDEALSDGEDDESFE